MKTKIISGKITSLNKDSTPMNEYKEEFEKTIEIYVNTGILVSISIDTLQLFIENEKVQKIVHYSPAFSNFLIDSIWRSSIICLHSYFSNDDRSFKKLFNYIKANKNKIFTGKFIDVIDYGDEIVERKIDKQTIHEMVEDCEKMISDKQELIDKLDAFRHNLYAHFSKDKKGLLNDKEITIQDLKTALNLAEQITNKLNVRYNRVHRSFKPINSTDVNNLGHILEMYDENKDEIIKMHRKKKYNL